MSIPKGLIFTRKFWNETFGSDLDDLMQESVPLDKVIARILSWLTFDLTVANAPSGNLSSMGVAALVKSITLRGRGDQDIIVPISGDIARKRSYRRMGKLPAQSGLPSSLSNGTYNARCYIPIDFIDLSSKNPHATDLDPRTWDDLTIQIELYDDLRRLYPDCTTVAADLSVANIKIESYVEQVENPIANFHATHETKFNKMKSLKVDTANPEARRKWPAFASIQSVMMNTTHEANAGYPVPVNGVMNNHLLKFGNTQFFKWDDTKEREKNEQFLDEIDTTLTGLTIIESSFYEREVDDTYDIDEQTEAISFMDVTNSGFANDVMVDIYYESIQEVRTVQQS